MSKGNHSITCSVCNTLRWPFESATEAMNWAIENGYKRGPDNDALICPRCQEKKIFDANPQMAIAKFPLPDSCVKCPLSNCKGITSTWCHLKELYYDSGRDGRPDYCPLEVSDAGRTTPQTTTIKFHPPSEEEVIITHYLKTLQPYFDAVEQGLKTFEVRKNDRGFHVGHFMVLQEYSHESGYSGREVKTVITYILDEPEYCKDGYVVIGFRTFFQGAKP